MLIYRTDLGHDLLRFSSDTYPLGIANLALYVKTHFAGEKKALRHAS